MAAVLATRLLINNKALPFPDGGHQSCPRRSDNEDLRLRSGHRRTSKWQAVLLGLTLKISQHKSERQGPLDTPWVWDTGKAPFSPGITSGSCRAVTPGVTVTGYSLSKKWTSHVKHRNAGSVFTPVSLPSWTQKVTATSKVSKSLQER